MAHNPGLAYTFVNKNVGGKTSTFVATNCSRCPTQQSFPWNSPNNPHHIAQRFRRVGWDFDPVTPKKNLCPDCNPHHKEMTNHHISLPINLKTVGERVSWLRARTAFSQVQVADAAGMPRRLYQQLEDNEIGNFTTLHTTIAAVVPFFKRHRLPITLRWIAGLPEDGCCLAQNFKSAMTAVSVTPGFLAAETHIPVTTIEGILNGSIEIFSRIDELATYLTTTPELLYSSIAPLPKEEKLPAVVVPPPPPPVKPITPMDMQAWRELVARRLRDKRKAERLSQGMLARRVLSIGLAGVNADTVQSYLSSIERAHPVSRAEDMLRVCATIFNTSPDWQCGKEAGVADLPPPPKEAPVSLPTFNIDIDSAQAAMRQVVALKADVVGLEGIINENVAIIERAISETREANALLAETRGKLDTLETVVIAIMSAYTVQAPTVTIEPVKVPVPSQPPPILTATPDAPGEVVGGAFCTWVSNAYIDRNADTKQNDFARLLTPSRFHGKAMSLNSVMDELKSVIDAVLPGVQKPREAVRRMVYREALAPNGLLIQTSQGFWKLRETTTLAAE